MKGVRRGILVGWGGTAPEPPVHLGVVLDHAAEPGTWWVMPEGQQVAVQLHSRELRSAPNRQRPSAWVFHQQPAALRQEVVLSTAEPGVDDLPMFDGGAA